MISLCSPESEGESILPDPTAPAAVAPSSETPETPPADPSDQQLPHVEEPTVLPLEKDEEEPISSTITLLEKEEESDEEKEKGGHREPNQGAPIHCSVPSSPPSCSCNASLREYLHQQCSASLSQKRECQSAQRKQTIASIQTPAWQRPLLPPGWHQPQQPHSEPHRPRQPEQAADAEPESRASSSEAPQPPESSASSKDSILEPPLLEPSQSCNLPKHSAADSSSAKPPPGAETPPLLPSGEPEKRQDVLAEERHVEPSAPPSGSSRVQPTVSITADESSSPASTEETIPADVSPSDTPDQTDPTLTPTSSPFYPDLPLFNEADRVFPEVPNLVPDLGAEAEPSSGHPVIADARSEDVSDDAASTSVPSSQPSSASLSDIYADPPNGTEPNGNPVHGSSQKESVFMRLNNRIKALEMNMSLSGRYLEQLSQR